MKNFEQALNAAKRVEEAGNYHDEIVVGLKSEFDFQEVAEYEDKFLVDGNLIFYTGNTSDTHQGAIGDLHYLLQNAFNERLGNAVLVYENLVCSRYVNEYGCHPESKKVPDLVAVPNRYRFTYPDKNYRFLLPVEVAFKNENLFQLLIEGFSWINHIQPFAHSSLLVKICDQTKSLRVMVILKSESGSPPNWEYLVASHTCESGTLLNPSWNSLVSKGTIEAYFGKQVHFDRIFEEVELREILALPPFPIIIPIVIWSPIDGNVVRLEVNIYTLIRNMAFDLLHPR